MADNLYMLEAKLIYALIVAGKSARFANKATDVWLRKYVHPDETPFAAVRRLETSGRLESSFRSAGTGNYRKISRACSELTDSAPDLRTCTPEELETFHGIGPKTSRFFILWTRPEARYAVLDVHLLRWLRSLGYKVPQTTPTSYRRYIEIEKIVLDIAEKEKLTPRELDLKIWGASATEPNDIKPPVKSPE